MLTPEVDRRIAMAANRKNKSSGMRGIFVILGAVVCVFGGTVFGQPWDGNGVEGGPYQIWDANDMQAIGANGSYWDKDFKLMADIDLSSFTGTSFNIIGIPWDEPFTGTFDGNNHTISNFTYTSTDTDFIGIFGHVSGTDAEIKDLGLINPSVSAGTGRWVGSLAGRFESGTIDNCFVQGGTVSGHEDVGGLISNLRDDGTIFNCYTSCDVLGRRASIGGLTGGNSGTITNCYASGNVTGEFLLGGLVGRHYGVILNSYATGTVSGSGPTIGGLVGKNYATISNCYSAADVSGGNQQVGGLVGDSFEGIISNCYSTGSVWGNQVVGGLVGENSAGTIYGSYSTGKVVGDSWVGGLVGWNWGAVQSSFWDEETSGRSSSSGGTGKTTAQMQTESTFTSADWDFNTPVWQMCDEICYPRLGWEQGTVIGLPPLLDFGALLDGANPLPRLLPIGNCVSGSLQWTISEDCNWLSLEPNSGTSAPFDSNDVTLTADINGLDYGFYSCDLMVTDPNAANSPQTIPVTLHVCIHTLGEIFVPDEYATIQEAIDAAGPDNIVMVDPGTHHENINFNGKNVKVSSTYPDDLDVIAATIIDGNNQGTVVTFESDEDPNCRLTGFTITNGNHKYEGGGIRINRDTSPTISNCIVAANEGLGIYSFRSQPKITNCIIAGNTAAGIQTTGRDSATITNCTIVENGAEGIYSSYGAPTVTNCIIWGNADPCIAERPIVTFSDIEGGSAGLGNIDQDPCFALPGLWVDINDANIILAPGDPNSIWLQGDYHLLEGSPCIDAGDPNYVAEPNETDLDGNPRVSDVDGDGNSVVDMGAYEFTIAEPVEPLEMLAELGEMVEELGLGEGVENSLLAKLKAAIGLLEDDNEKNDGAAVNILGAFINAASAQSGKKIPESQAEALIAEAAAIIEALESG